VKKHLAMFIEQKENLLQQKSSKDDSLSTPQHTPTAVPKLKQQKRLNTSYNFYNSYYIYKYLKKFICMYTASVVEGLESMTSNPVTFLAWVRSPGDALVV
jgi:hypothetical protein